MRSGYDFSAYDDTAADTCSKCYKNHILRSGRCTFPCLTKCGYVCIVSCLCFQSCKVMKDLRNRSKSPVKIHCTCSLAFWIDWSRDADSHTFYICFIDFLFFEFEIDCICNIRKNVLSFILCSCRNFPFVYQSTVCLEKTTFYSCTSYINSEAIWTHLSSTFPCCLLC